MNCKTYRKISFVLLLNLLLLRERMYLTCKISHNNISTIVQTSTIV